MRFEISESKHGKLDGIIEGENLMEVMETFSEQVGVKFSRLRVTMEFKKDNTPLYLIFKGKKKVAVMEPV